LGEQVALLALWTQPPPMSQWLFRRALAPSERERNAHRAVQREEAVVKRTIARLIGIAVLALALPAAAADTALNGLIPRLTRGTQWNQVSAVTLQFPTFHPQGMLKIGDAFFVSSVEIRKPTTRYPSLQDGYDRDRSIIPAASTMMGSSSGCRLPNTGRTASRSSIRSIPRP
jgi:hypothetical protein